MYNDKIYYQGEECFLMSCNYLISMHMNNGELVVGPSRGYFGADWQWNQPGRDYPHTQEEATKYLHAHFKIMKDLGFNCVRIMNASIKPRYNSDNLAIILWHRFSNIANPDPVPSRITYEMRQYEEYLNLDSGGLESLKNAMKLVSDVAEQYDIKLIWVMGCEARYKDENNVLNYRSIINPPNHPLSLKYNAALANIATEFNNNSSIFAYELFHESESYNGSAIEVDKAEVAIAVKDIVHKFRQIDTKHLTTVGLFDILSILELGIAPFKYCDFYNYHIYDEINRIDGFDCIERGKSINRQIQYLSNTIDFPWMIGEVGEETIAEYEGEGCSTPHPISQTEQKTFAAKTLECTIAKGGLGYIWWQFHNEAGWQNLGLLKNSGSTTVPIKTNPAQDFTIYGTYKEIANPSVFNNFTTTGVGCNINNSTYYNLLGTVPDPSSGQVLTWRGAVKSYGVNFISNAVVRIKVEMDGAFINFDTFTDEFGLFELTIPTQSPNANITISKYGYNTVNNTQYSAGSNNTFYLAETSQPAKENFPNYFVKQNIIVNDNQTLTFDDAIIVLGDIFVNDNATLIIEDTVYFDDNSELIINPGGKLILDDGAVLTALHHYWVGIKAYNTEVNLIEIVTTGNSVISKADVAIRTLYDVALNLNGTDFYNNMCDISMKLNDAQMLFRNCDFIQTADAIDPCMDSPSCDYCVDLYECGHVKFTNCHFDDQRIGTIQVNKSGICAENIDKLEVLPNPLMGAQRSSFINLKYGIKAIANGGGELIVKNTDFKAARGIYLYNYMGFLPKTITNNTFEVLNFPKTSDKDIGNPGGEEPDEFECQAYGVYVDKTSNKYQIEGNIFKGEDGNADYRYGLIANNTGFLYNEFYRNKFLNLENAVQSININKGDELDEGLQILCNNFNDTRTDIYVTTDNNSVYGGISSLQGSTSSPAGNLFSNGAVCNYNNEMMPLTYFARINTDPYWNYREWPESVNDGEQVMLHLVNYSWLSNACPDNANKLPKPVDAGLLRLQMESAEELETAITSMLDDLVDGGNTGLTISSVLHSDDNSAWLTYYELMSKSPYLSDTVLKEVSKKEQGLTAPMIRDILVANPQGIKNKDLQQLLKDRNNQLPDYMITQIESGLGIISAKENLEIQKAEQRVIYEESLKTLVAYYQSVADSLPYAEDSIVSLLCERNEKQYMDVLADYFFTKSDFTSASDIVNRILSVCTLSQEEKDQYSELKDFYQFYNNLLAFYKGDLSNLNAMHIAELKEYENRKGMAAVKATALLIINDASDYIEPVYKPQPVLEDRLFKQNISIKSNPYFSVYPNPAKEYIYVEYMLTEQIGALQIAITDVSGKMYLQKELIQLQDIVILKTVDLPEGSYNCSLYNGNKLVYNSKIIISK